MMHELIYYAAQMVAILGRPRHSLLKVSRDTPARLIPASDQAWQPFAPLPTKNSCIIQVKALDPPLGVLMRFSMNNSSCEGTPAPALQAKYLFNFD